MERRIGVSEAAKRIGCSARHVRRLIADNKLVARRAGPLGWLKIEVGSIDAYMSGFVPRGNKPDIENRTNAAKPDAKTA